MKTFDRKDVYSWANCEEAKQYIGKLGFYSNNFPTLKTKVKNCEPKELIAVNDYGIGCFIFDSTDSGYGLFLPLDKVKEVEETKKWREFRTFEEFVLAVGLIGCHVRYRLKADKDNEFLAIVNGFNYKAQSITINAVRYTFNELFDKFELFKNQKWQPFGVEE